MLSSVSANRKINFVSDITGRKMTTIPVPANSALENASESPSCLRFRPSVDVEGPGTRSNLSIGGGCASGVSFLTEMAEVPS